jgi:hypothetical protein
MVEKIKLKGMIKEMSRLRSLLLRSCLILDLKRKKQTIRRTKTIGIT